MQDYQQRVVDEKNELEGKRARLRAFLESDACSKLPSDERARLSIQDVWMSGYSQVLGERIDAF